MQVIQNMIELTMNASMAEIACLKPLFVAFYKGAEGEESDFPKDGIESLWATFELKSMYNTAVRFRHFGVQILIKAQIE